MNMILIAVSAFVVVVGIAVIVARPRIGTLPALAGIGCLIWALWTNGYLTFGIDDQYSDPALAIEKFETADKVLAAESRRKVSEVEFLLRHDEGAPQLEMLAEKHGTFSFDSSENCVAYLSRDDRGVRHLVVQKTTRGPMGGYSTTGAVVGLPTQVDVDSIGLEGDDIALSYSLSGSNIRKLFGVEPGVRHRVTVSCSAVCDAKADFINLWKGGTPESR